MATELKATVINLKTLSQDIPDPIVVGAGDMMGRKLRVIFTQEAAAQFTPNTKVYLSWLHQENNIKGYNVFTEIKNPTENNFPPTWEITYPKSMLYEGNVLACLEIVDDVSIATSVNFIIHVLTDPNDGDPDINESDYSNFQKIITQVNTLIQNMSDQIASQQSAFEEIQNTFTDMQETVDNDKELSENAQETAAEALEITQNFQEILSQIRLLAASADTNATKALEVAEDQNNAVVTLQNEMFEIRKLLRELDPEKVAEIYNFIDNWNNNNYEDKIQTLTQFVDNWANTIETDIQPLIDEAKQEMLHQLEVKYEEAQTEHQALWNMFNFTMLDDNEEVGG